MMPPNHILRKCTGRYKLHKSKEKSNQLTYMDDIIVCKNEKELEIRMRIYSDDMKKCAMLIMKSEKRQITERIDLSTKEKN